MLRKVVTLCLFGGLVGCLDTGSAPPNPSQGAAVSSTTHPSTLILSDASIQTTSSQASSAHQKTVRSDFQLVKALLESKWPVSKETVHRLAGDPTDMSNIGGVSKWSWELGATRLKASFSENGPMYEFVVEFGDAFEVTGARGKAPYVYELWPYLCGNIAPNGLYASKSDLMRMRDGPGFKVDLLGQADINGVKLVFRGKTDKLNGSFERKVDIKQDRITSVFHPSDQATHYDSQIESITVSKDGYNPNDVYEPLSCKGWLMSQVLDSSGDNQVAKVIPASTPAPDLSDEEDGDGPKICVGSEMAAEEEAAVANGLSVEVVGNWERHVNGRPAFNEHFQLKPNGHFEHTLGELGKEAKVVETGTWSLVGDKVHLEYLTVGGQPITGSRDVEYDKTNQMMVFGPLTGYCRRQQHPH